MVQVVGPICESGDVLGADRRLPACREGDVLLVAQAGAYGRVMASHYNLRDPAPETVLPARTAILPQTAETSEANP
jgi:diaminopimelate decarboxylase/aspartate kinase